MTPSTFRDTNVGPFARFVGVDHGFSFPLAYFTRHGLRGDWDDFLWDFQEHWPCAAPGTRVQDVRRGLVGRAQTAR